MLDNGMMNCRECEQLEDDGIQLECNKRVNI